MKNKSFSMLLEDLRLTRNISKTDLAKLANLTPGYISHLTRGERAAPSEGVVQILADALQLDAKARIEFFAVAGYNYDMASSLADAIPSLEEMQVSTSTGGTTATKVNWDDIPDVNAFYGRDNEQELLAQWLGDEGCRVVAILGIGGIGKTSLAAKLITAIYQQFDCVYWQSLRDVPPIETVLTECIQFLSDQKVISLQGEDEDRLPILLETLSQCLRERRCLIVLDNFESVLQSGERAGKYQVDYEEFGRLIQSVGEGKHQSSLILTSREKPKEIVLLEGKTALVRSMSLPGLFEPDVKKLISDKGLSGSDEVWTNFIQLYSGNPLALKLAAEPVLELFEGDIDAFLHERETVFGDIYELIEKQFHRLSPLEQIVMYWLAIEREPVSLEQLQEKILPRVSKKDLLEILTSLRRRSMIEPTGTARFWLQPVIMEFTIDQLIENIHNEIINLEPQLLISCALLNAHAKDDIRNSEMRLILAPIARWLEADLGGEESMQVLKNLLNHLREMKLQAGDYAVGNVLNLLNQSNADLSSYDFSGQVIRHAFLQGVTLAGVNFANATFVDSIFTDTFGKILSVAISPNGKLLAAGAANNEIRLWKLPNIVPLLTLQGHSDWVRSVAFSPDSKLLASASEDKTVQIWDAGTGKQLDILRDHSSLVYCVAFSPDGKLFASCGDDQTIRLWDVNSHKCVKVLTGHENKVWSVAFSRDSQLLISGSDDQTLRLWEISSGRPLHVLKGHTSKIWTVAFSPNGELVASGSHDRTIRLWDVSSGECVKVLYGHSSWVYFVTFSPDGTLLASGSDDRQVGLWNVKTGRPQLLDRHSNRVRSVAFSPDSTLLASGSDDQTIRLWEVKTGQCLSILQGYSNEVWAVAFSPDSKLLASGSEDQLVRLWDIDSGQCTKTLSGHANRIQTVAFSPDGTLLATGSDDQTARIWEVNTEECLAILQEPNTWIWAVAFSPDGSLLATAGEDLVVRIWDTSPSVTCINVLHGHTNWIWSAAFSPDGNLLATGSDDQTARIWEVSSGKSLHILNRHGNRVRAVAFSPDGKLLATGSDDEIVRLWNVETGECIRELKGHDGWVRAVAFSPDGTCLATGSDDQTIRFWQVSTGHCIEILRGHTNRVRSVDFSPDGALLASGGQDGKIILWKAQTGELRQELISRRPYEDANITGVKGLSMAQRVTLRALGAVEK